jgi:hypothetical protein
LRKRKYYCPIPLYLMHFSCHDLCWTRYADIKRDKFAL